LEEISRCEGCGGILDAEEAFEVVEACSCSTRRGRRARSKAAQQPESRERVNLSTILSDPGTVW